MRDSGVLKIWTDGSCKGNGKEENIGGWAFLVEWEDDIWFSNSGSEKNTTNNRMELYAVYKGLRLGYDYYKSKDSVKKIIIYTDSAYIYNAYVQKWYKKWQKNDWQTANKTPVKNQDLWEKLIPFFENDLFIIKKVKGHSNIKQNEKVDFLAQRAADGQ